MSEKNFNVLVIGLSGCDEEGKEYKVGKSLFCNRFVRPSIDDLILDHKSVFTKELLSSLVIHEDNYLYWGSVSMRVENGDVVRFNVYEYTHLRSDNDEYISNLIYLKYSIIRKLAISSDKYMYICYDQVQNLDNYPKVKAADTGKDIEIHGFIIIYNSDSKVDYIYEQTEFLTQAIKKIKKLNKPCILALTKCDKSNTMINFTKEIELLLYKKYNDPDLIIPAIETSALLNVNIISAFQLLYSISEPKGQILKIKSYYDAYRVVERFNTMNIDTFSKMIIYSNEPASKIKLEKIIEDPKNAVKIKNLTDIVGKEGIIKIFNECKLKKISKIKEKLLQYYLKSFETCLVSLHVKWSEIDTEITNINQLIEYLKTTNLFEEYFEENLENLNDLEYIENKLEKIKLGEEAKVRIPINVLDGNRFDVVLKQHVNKIASFSRKQYLKNKYESVLYELLINGKFSIKSTSKEIKEILEQKQLNELVNFIDDPSFKELFNIYYQKILLKAKYKLDELMFEKCIDLKSIKYENKQQIVQEFSERIGDDKRYQIFDGGLEELRSNWIFIHFTFFTSNTFCLLSPLSTCCDKLSKNVLSSLSDQNDNNNTIINVDNENYMILFIITTDEIYHFFEEQFHEITLQSSKSYHEVFLNGKNKRILPVKISSVDVDWDVILNRYKEDHFSFMAIYGDAQSYKLIENVFSKLHSVFIKIIKSQQDQQYESTSCIEKISSSANFYMNNIVVTFCLLPQIVDEYRTFITRVQDYTFFQESMLGRLLEQGRNLSNKYSAKFIGPYLDEIIQNKTVPVLHETQLIDSIRYLEETTFDDDNMLYKKFSPANIIKIIVCCMCGDNYPMELIIGIFLFNRKYEYSNRRETVYIQYQMEDNSSWLISLRFLSYHSAQLTFSREQFHGCILVYNTSRECSYQVMRSFVQKERGCIYHVIGISGFSSHSRITMQKTMNSEEMSNIRRAELELSDLDHTKDINNQILNINTFFKMAIQHVKQQNVSCTDTPSLSVLNYDFTSKYGTFQFRKKPSIDPRKSKNTSSVIEADPAQNSTFKVQWSDNPAFPKQQSHIIDRHASEMVLNKTPDKGSMGTLKRKKKKSNIKTGTLRHLKGLTNKIFERTSSTTKDYNPSSSKDSSSRISQQDKAMNSSRTSISDDTKKASITNRFAAAFKYQKRTSEPDIESKMHEWEKNFSNKSQLSQFKYFGKPIDEVPLFKGIPIFVIKCILFIEENGLTTEGLYRKSGLKQDIEALKIAFEADYNIDFNKLGFNVHVYTGAMKYFFSNLTNYLIPNTLNPEILKATSNTDPSERITKFKEIIGQLPEKNHKTLSYLIYHFSRIHELNEKNKMDARNLAICFWPNLIHFTYSLDIGSLANGSNMLFSLFIHTLIENCCTIFGEPIIIQLDELGSTSSDN